MQWCTAVSKLVPQGNPYCLNKLLLHITKSLQPEVDYTMKRCPNSKALRARSNKLVLLCGSVSFTQHWLQLCVCLCGRWRVSLWACSSNEEKACCSHAPLKHEKQCRKASWQRNQHTHCVSDEDFYPFFQNMWPWRIRENCRLNEWMEYMHSLAVRFMLLH